MQEDGLTLDKMPIKKKKPTKYWQFLKGKLGKKRKKVKKMSGLFKKGKNSLVQGEFVIWGWQCPPARDTGARWEFLGIFLSSPRFTNGWIPWKDEFPALWTLGWNSASPRSPGLNFAKERRTQRIVQPWPSCPGQWWHPHPWRGLKDVWVWNFGTGFSGGLGNFGGILEGFS